MKVVNGSLLILDESTNGFSIEHLFKLNDILSALGCKRVIMVSHEHELGFDNTQVEVGKRLKGHKGRRYFSGLEVNGLRLHFD